MGPSSTSSVALGLTLIQALFTQLPMTRSPAGVKKSPSELASLLVAVSLVQTSVAVENTSVGPERV